MNLCERLQTKRPPWVRIGYYFKYKGAIFEGKGNLISEIAERFSFRFGRISGKQANEIYRRLSEKYSSYPGSMAIFKSLQFSHAAQDDIAHPLELRRASLEARLKKESELELVDRETKNAKGIFCKLHSERNPCVVCGRFTIHETEFKGVIKTHYKFRKMSVCLHNRCQALLEMFPDAFGKRKTKEFPLISILKDISKNDEKNNENKRRLEKHFVRCA